VRAITVGQIDIFGFLKAREAVIHSQTTITEALRISQEEGLESMVAFLLAKGVDPPS
jgi:hypothetical protein